MWFWGGSVRVAQEFGRLLNPGMIVRGEWLTGFEHESGVSASLILQQVLSCWIHTPYFYLDVNEMWIQQVFSWMAPYNLYSVAVP